MFVYIMYGVAMVDGDPKVWLQKGHPWPHPQKMYFKCKQYKCKKVTHAHAHVRFFR